jgi:hypothetical protein
MPKNKELDLTPPETTAHDLNDCAQAILDVLYPYDPVFKERDMMLSAEQGLSASQRVLRYCAVTLEQNRHLDALSGYDFIQGKPRVQDFEINHLGEATCAYEKCDKGENGARKTFRPQYPGQACCSNECGNAHFPPAKRQEFPYPPDFFTQIDPEGKSEPPAFRQRDAQ